MDVCQATTYLSYGFVVKKGKEATLSIPDHKNLKRPLLGDLIKDAEMTKEEFLYYLRGKKEKIAF